ncbi:MAG: hemolysin III family protein [Actinobacteria bacterium]|nr:hemolysin III family protein [Actinomycetota bacterium]
MPIGSRLPSNILEGKMERVTLGRMQNPVRGFLHGGAAVAAAAGLAQLASTAWGNEKALAGAVTFGSALVAMFTVSTIYHSVPWGERWKGRWQRIDHAMIYVLVAATFTPIAIAALDDGSLGGALALIWGTGLAGVLLKLGRRSVGTGLSITLQVGLGLAALMWVRQIVERLGAGAVYMIVAGGLFYLAGVVVFVSKRPRISPRTFSYHEVFHLLVVAGSLLHFLAVLLYAIPVTV